MCKKKKAIEIKCIGQTAKYVPQNNHNINQEIFIKLMQF